MKLDLDREHNEPLHQQIVRQVETLILSGELPSGSGMPTERHLASLLRIHRSTVTKAYEQLRAAGLIHSVQGRGTFVADSMWDLQTNHFPRWSQYMSSGVFRPTISLLRKVHQLTPDPSYINLADGEVSLELLPTAIMKDLLKQGDMASFMHYSDPRGERGFRQEIARHVKRQYGIEADEDEILVTSGGQQAMHLITQCLLSPGDSIAIECPSYHYSLPLFMSSGIRLLRIPVDQDGMIPSSLQELHRAHRIRMVITSPTYQNPTGVVLAKERRLELIRICRGLSIPIVEDHTFSDIRLHGEAPPLPLIANTGVEGSVLYFGSLSKSAAPGFRIGWIIGPRSVISRMADIKQQFDFGASPLMQELTSRYLESGGWSEQLERIRTALSRNQETMLHALDRHLQGKAEWTRPGGGYHIWCRMLQPAAETSLLEEGIRQGVLMVPGRVYGAEAGYVRLSYARASEGEIAEGIARLARAVSIVAAGQG